MKHTRTQRKRLGEKLSRLLEEIQLEDDADNKEDEGNDDDDGGTWLFAVVQLLELALEQKRQCPKQKQGKGRCTKRNLHEIISSIFETLESFAIRLDALEKLSESQSAAHQIGLDPLPILLEAVGRRISNQEHKNSVIETFNMKTAGEWDCPISDCSRRLGRLDTLHEHIRRTEGYGHTLLKRLIDARTCFECDHIFNKPPGLTKHERDTHDKRYQSRLQQFTPFWRSIEMKLRNMQNVGAIDTEPSRKRKGTDTETSSKRKRTDTEPSRRRERTSSNAQPPENVPDYISASCSRASDSFDPNIGHTSREPLPSDSLYNGAGDIRSRSAHSSFSDDANGILDPQADAGATVQHAIAGLGAQIGLLNESAAGAEAANYGFEFAVDPQGTVLGWAYSAYGHPPSATVGSCNQNFDTFHTLPVIDPVGDGILDFNFAVDPSLNLGAQET